MTPISIIHLLFARHYSCTVNRLTHMHFDDRGISDHCNFATVNCCELGRPRSRWVDNIKMDLREIGWGGSDVIDLGQDRDQCKALVSTVMNLRVP
jgi:hypothetical protein